MVATHKTPSSACVCGFFFYSSKEDLISGKTAILSGCNYSDTTKYKVFSQCINLRTCQFMIQHFRQQQRYVYNAGADIGATPKKSVKVSVGQEW